MKLTRALLKQLRKVDRLPDDWMEKDTDGRLVKLKAEFVVGWFDGSVLGEEYVKFVLLQNLKGDLYLWGMGVHYSPEKHHKQLYI